MSKFIKQPEWLVIGKYKIDISRISAGRVLYNIDKYNSIINKKYSSEKEASKDIIGVALNMIQIDFSIDRIFDWFKRKVITKNYVLKVCTMDELNKFLEDCFKSIIEPKKKVLEKNSRLTDLGLRIAEKLPEEELIKLLSKFQS